MAGRVVGPPPNETIDVTAAIDVEADARAAADAQLLQKGSNLSDVPDKAAARANLGISTASSHHHDQPTPAAVWTITHNLGYRPAGVFVEDTAHSQWWPRIHHVDNNTLTLSFFVGSDTGPVPAPVAGTADLS